MCWLFGCIRFWVDLPHCPIMTPTITYPCGRLWGLKSGTSRNGTGNGQSEPTSAAASKRQGGETNLRRRTQHLTARWAHVGDTLLTGPNTTRHNTTQHHTTPKQHPNNRLTATIMRSHNTKTGSSRKQPKKQKISPTQPKTWHKNRHNNRKQETWNGMLGNESLIPTYALIGFHPKQKQKGWLKFDLINHCEQEGRQTASPESSDWELVDEKR